MELNNLGVAELTPAELAATDGGIFFAGVVIGYFLYVFTQIE